MGLWMLLALLIPVGTTPAAFFPGGGPMAPITKSAVSFPDYDMAAHFLQTFETQMSPLVTQRGGHLHLILEIENAKVNAQAMREGNDWNIVVYGGMIRHPDIHEAEMTMILCHELGHHLGGAPTASRTGWSACEGQADYWSTLTCFKALRPHDDGHIVALNLARLYYSMGTGSMPSLDYQDATRPIRTWYGYPSPQCRLDTLVAGLKESPRPICWFVQE